MPEVVATPERTALLAWGATLRRYRQWRQLSRRQLAAQAGISAVFLGEIERGEKEASVTSLTRLTEALNISLPELYLRVALHLEQSQEIPPAAQPALPLAVREESDAYLAGVPPAQDETAFDLYRVARHLRGEQQMSLLMLARSLIPAGNAS